VARSVKRDDLLRKKKDEQADARRRYYVKKGKKFQEKNICVELPTQNSWQREKKN
jgi:small-conductance mechanosensitive channel